jgi:AraC-like DNA-binding protein
MIVECPLIIRDLVVSPGDEWSPSPPYPGWTVVRVAEGSGYSLLRGSPRELQTGDGFMAPHTTRMTVRASQLDVLRLQYFQIRPDLLSGLLTVAESWRLKTLPGGAPYIFFFKANELNGQELSRLMEQVSGGSLAARCGLLQIWARSIAGLFGPPMPAKVDERKLRGRFSQLMEQLPAIELLNLSPSELARQLQCSERHFRRLFHQKFSVPFRRHQIELRLLRASHLLADPSIKIASIAYESGYQHLGLFNAAFKKRFGITPSEWRRRNSPANFPSPPPHPLPPPIDTGVAHGAPLNPRPDSKTGGSRRARVGN